jgi:hypothetical protein
MSVIQLKQVKMCSGIKQELKRVLQKSSYSMSFGVCLIVVPRIKLRYLRGHSFDYFI